MNGVIGGTSLLLDACANLTVEQKEVLKIVKTSGEVMLTMSATHSLTHARTHGVGAQGCQSGDLRADGGRSLSRIRPC
jgi:hypothetical protein